jgi:hypothetical protein
MAVLPLCTDLRPLRLGTRKVATVLFLFPHLLFIPHDTTRTYMMGALQRRFEDGIENSFLDSLVQDPTVDFYSTIYLDKC